MQTAYASVKPHTAMDTIDKPLPYSPGFPQRAYELGTPTFHKQYETPILSNYFHDVMPYYMCCIWTVNRCQFFYWRRPSSGCQEYQSPKIASVFGAGHFISLQNEKFTVLIDGIFTYFHKANDHLGPEVNIQIRLEKYPNRQVDPSHRNTFQENLVEPTNSVVATGVAIQEGSGVDTDRVIVLCRKDTRRFKYRTSVLVNDEIRYFDTMKVQKFRSVMIYINDVKEGQSEVYVTLLKSRIGLRIRESFGYVIGLQPIFEESMGLLDIQVSVPPEYFQIPNNSTIVGLANRMVHTTTFPDKVDETTYTNLFTLKNSDHKDWPESSLLKPIYVVAGLKYMLQNTDPTQLYDRTEIPPNIRQCLNFPGYTDCPSINIIRETNETCWANNWCIFDIMTVFQRQIGARTLIEFSEEKRLRNDMENRTHSILYTFQIIDFENCDTCFLDSRSSHTTKTIAQPKAYDDNSASENESPIRKASVDDKVRYNAQTSLKPAEIGSSPKSWTFTAV
uniref:AMOP domain-containing protein n=1 Tax=Romanomermis culicivorax TaxID=13658 RepID=A0A915JKT4_ROMCU